MRKLSFEETLRHRLRDLPQFRIREETSPTEGLLYFTVGAVAGLAAGVALAQRYGGFGALASRLRDRFGRGEDLEEYESDDEDRDEEGDYELSPLEELEERVLDAFHNDPILSERAIYIGAIDEGIIELTGWVYAAGEATHAMTIARGTPGVATVVNRLAVRDEEAEYDDRAERYAAGDDSLREAHWEGQQVGIGRPRQGTSADPDRHADPKVPLEERWMNESAAYRDAADAVEGLAERRTSGKAPQKGDRTGGAPVAPTGVPKGDHVVDPTHAPPSPSTGTGDTEAPRGD